VPLAPPSSVTARLSLNSQNPQLKLSHLVATRGQCGRDDRFVGRFVAAWQDLYVWHLNEQHFKKPRIISYTRDTRVKP